MSRVLAFRVMRPQCGGHQVVYRHSMTISQASRVELSLQPDLTSIAMVVHTFVASGDHSFQEYSCSNPLPEISVAARWQVEVKRSRCHRASQAHSGAPGFTGRT